MTQQYTSEESEWNQAKEFLRRLDEWLEEASMKRYGSDYLSCYHALHSVDIKIRAWMNKEEEELVEDKRKRALAVAGLGKKVSVGWMIKDSRLSDYELMLRRVMRRCEMDLPKKGLAGSGARNI